MKTCSKCKIEKPLDGFGKNKAKKDGLRSECKACNKEYREQNKAEIAVRQKEWYQQNKTSEAARKKEYYEQNKAAKLAYRREYYKQNKAKIAAQKKEYEKTRLEEDPFFRLTYNVRRLIKGSFQNKGYSKKSRTHQILGCSFEEFKEHLHNNPYGFEIDMDGLDIDHIIPLSTAQSEEHLLELNHYTNFQLLPSEYNRFIKKDNEWDQTDFEAWFENQKILEALC